MGFQYVFKVQSYIFINKNWKKLPSKRWILGSIFPFFRSIIAPKSASIFIIQGQFSISIFYLTFKNFVSFTNNPANFPQFCLFGLILISNFSKNWRKKPSKLHNTFDVLKILWTWFHFHPIRLKPLNSAPWWFNFTSTTRIALGSMIQLSVSHQDCSLIIIFGEGNSCVTFRRPRHLDFEGESFQLNMWYIEWSVKVF